MWLPDRITPLAPNSRTKGSLTSQGWISQYTCAFTHATSDELGVLGAEVRGSSIFLSFDAYSTR